MGELAKLPNIGKVVEEQLNQVGIKSVEELKQIGAKFDMPINYEALGLSTDYIIKIERCTY